MADEIDIQALHDGERDLVQADFRGANLSHTDISNRDLSRAVFDKANLKKADLRNSLLVGASFTQADMSDVNLEGCSAEGGFVHVNLTRANLRLSKFRSCIFHTCDFSGADLRGADFTKANFINDNILEGVLTDETTIFEGAKILRPSIRNQAFRYYNLEKGILTRKTSIIVEEPPITPLSVAQSEILSQIELVQRSVLPIVGDQSLVVRNHDLIGHNNPPEDFALNREDFDNLQYALNDIKDRIYHQNRDLAPFSKSLNVIFRICKKVTSWILQKINIVSDSFFDEIGKTLASTQSFITISLIATGNMSKLIELVDNFIK